MADYYLIEELIEAEINLVCALQLVVASLGGGDHLQFKIPQ